MKTLQQQIDCVKREIAIRKGLYPKWIGTRMSADKCRHEIECMECVLETLMEQQKPNDPGLWDEPATSGSLGRACDPSPKHPE